MSTNRESENIRNSREDNEHYDKGNSFIYRIENPLEKIPPDFELCKKHRVIIAETYRRQIICVRL